MMMTWGGAPPPKGAAAALWDLGPAPAPLGAAATRRGFFLVTVIDLGSLG